MDQPSPYVHMTRLSSSTPLHDSFAQQHGLATSSAPASAPASASASADVSPHASPRYMSDDHANGDAARMDGWEDDALDEDGGAGGSEWAGMEGMTPLDSAIEKIGMGPYQRWLLVLCGFGWTCDNAWLQCVAIILPRVQVHFAVSDRWIGLLSSSLFFGMTFGSTGFGSLSDAYGRKLPYYITLVWTAIAGFLASMAPSFGLLCVALFLLGIGVGGAMPTDGTLFLENTPRSKHYLLTGLSLFFSLGAVISSILGLVILPRYSCPHPSEGDVTPCDVDTQNQGWRYVLAGLGAITGIFYACRVCLFRLQESAKYLVTAGRGPEALVALRNISAYNGRPSFHFTLRDVRDSEPDGSGRKPEPAVGDDSYEAVALEEDQAAPPLLGRRPTNARLTAAMEKYLPSSAKRGLDDLIERVEFLFGPEWAKTTILVWSIWLLVSFGYTCFNVFLPKYLEEKLGDDVAGGGGLKETLHEYLLYTASGCPGSLLGAWLIETRLGRRYSMALSTLLTAVGAFVFVLVQSKSGVVGSSMLVSLMSTLMYAVIYGYTPEVFPSRVRGTACGLAAAFSRIAGITAPLLTGALLSVSTGLPLYVSAVSFLASCACMVMLPIETRNASRT